MINLKCNLRTAEAADIKSIVSVHIISFPGFFLTFLGPQFLKELYLGIMNDNYGILLVAEKEGDTVGFVAGSVAPNGFYRRLLQKRWWRFALPVISAALKKPSVIQRFLRVAKNVFFTNGQSHESSALLMSIAVLPKIQRSGAGGLLVKAFCTACEKQGVSIVSLTTDKFENDSVNLFYRTHGFSMAKEITTDENRVMNKYVVILGSVQNL